MLLKKLCFRRCIVHLPDLMAAFFKSYEKKEPVEGVLFCVFFASFWKEHGEHNSHNNNNRKYNYEAKIQNKMTLFHLVPA